MRTIDAIAEILKREGIHLLPSFPTTPMIEAAKAHAPNCVFNIRVTHASGMLEGKYTEDTVFPENDHRRHRPRSWLVNGVPADCRDRESSWRSSGLG